MVKTFLRNERPMMRLSPWLVIFALTIGGCVSSASCEPTFGDHCGCEVQCLTGAEAARVERGEQCDMDCGEVDWTCDEDAGECVVQFYD